MDQPDSPPLRRRRSRLKQWLNERVPWRSSSKSSQSRLSSHIAPTKANAVPAETAVTSESSPHPSGTQIEPKIDSVEESVPEDAVGATNRKRQSPPTDSASAEPPAGTATLDEHRPTTHLSSPLNPKDVAAQPEQSPTQSVWHSESAPQWNTAVIQWKIEDPNEFVGMQKLGIEISESPIDNMNKTFRFQESEKTSKQTVARIKRWLPVLSAVRGIAMTAAALDPHKIAPIVCASVFFSIDLVLNSMIPEDRDKILDILSECGNTIAELISFETNFLKKKHPAIEKDVQKMAAGLPAQYIRALRLVYDIQFSLRPPQGESKTEWIKHKGRGIWTKLSNKILEWQTQANALKRDKASWATERKSLDDKLAADEFIVKVRAELKKKEDPEPSLDFIRKTVTSEGRYENSTPWLFENEAFNNWCNTSPATANQPASKRVLWIKGGYGTGKTTLLYHVYSALKYRADFSAPGEVRQIAPYFCNASTGSESKRPDFETIVRSMCSSLSLLPDFTIAQAALDEYNKRTSTREMGQDPNEPFVDPWEKLLRTFLREGPSQSQVVFLVDALDECDISEAEHLLEFMKEIMTAHQNVQLICSSHQQVRVREYMGTEILHEIEVTAEVTEPEIRVYIRDELDHRRKGVNDSIFFEPNQTHLLQELQETLITNAQGMFQWVKVWLAILLPIRNRTHTIRLVEDAKKKLKGLKDDNTHAHDLYQRLEAGYQRLWDLNALVGYESRRIRLFQFVLGSSSLVTTEILTEVLRIQKCTYTKEVNRRDVELLYANFLHDIPYQGIQFVHNSARKFVLNMKVKNAAGEDSEREQFSEKESHMSIARLYIEIMSCSSHPYWQHLGIDPSIWTDVYLDPKKMDRLRHDFFTCFHLFQENLHRYLAIYGFRHCFIAAQKRSMFDGLWTEVLDRVILSPESAFGFVARLQPTFANPNSEKPLHPLNDCHLLRLHHGRLELLYSHCLAFLDIIDRDDLARLQLGEFSIEVGSEKDRQRRLFEHVACKGVSSGSLPLTIHSKIQPGDQTALHIALWRRNAAAVEIILQAALVLSEFRCIAGMLSKPRRDNSPLSMAILDSQFPLAEKLLLWERKCWEKSEAYEPARPFVTSQWSAKDEESGRTALSLAIQHFTEDQTCHLLSLVRPDDSNMLDEKPIPRNTPLHIAAAYGYLQLVTDLVEKYGANSLAINSRMETPAFCAFQFYRKNVLEYLGGKGDTGDFDASSRPKRPPTARDLEEWMFLGWIDPEIEISRRRRTTGCSTPGKAGFICDIELIKGIKDEKKLALAQDDHWYHSGESSDEQELVLEAPVGTYHY